MRLGAWLLIALGCGNSSSSPTPVAPPNPASQSVSQSAPPAAPAKPKFVPSDIPRFDVHTHIEPGALPRAVELLGRHHIVEMVNLSGGSPGGDGLEDSLDEAKRVGHT